MKDNSLENKIQRLEELLLQWKEENDRQKERFEKRIVYGLVKYICIIVAALGAIWSVIELAEWYWKQYKLDQLIRTYINAANKGYQKNRNPEIALAIINKALELTPDDPDLRYKQLFYQSHATLSKLPSFTSFHAKDFEVLNKLSADLILQKELTSENGELYLLEALLLKKQHKYSKSIDALERAIKLGVEYPYAECLRIENLLLLEKYDQALEKSERLLKKHPESKYSYYIYGKVLQKQRRYYEAQQYFLKALEYDNSAYDSLRGVAVCAGAMIPRDYECEQKYYQKIIAYYPQNFAAHSGLIRSCIKKGNYAAATLYLRRAERIFPKKCYALQGELYLKQKKFSQAEEACLKAFHITPENTNFQRLLVSTYIASGNFKKAVEYNKIIGNLAMEMDDERAMNNAAWRFFLIGTEYDFAQKLSEKAILKNNCNSYSYGTLSDIYFRKGDYQKSLKIIDKAIAVADNARKPVHRVEKALKLIELKETTMVRGLLRQVEQLVPHYYRLHLAYGEYYLVDKDIEKAQNAVNTGKKYAVNAFEKTELLMLEAKINAAAGKWNEAKLLQKEALNNIDNSFSEVRIAWGRYAEYCIKSNDRKEAVKAVKILNSIDKKHPETIRLQNLFKSAVPDKGR